MKAFRALFVLAILLGCATAAFANSNNDPTIIIKDPTCKPSKCTAVGTHFSFKVPESGRGALLFNNASGAAWTSLRLLESGVAANLITCITTVFANCTVGTLANGETFIFLSGGAGITAGENFSITFGCRSGSCTPWPAGLNFSAVATPVPEPATLALSITGLAAIITRRKWLNRVQLVS